MHEMPSNVKVERRAAALTGTQLLYPNSSILSDD